MLKTLPLHKVDIKIFDIEMNHIDEVRIQQIQKMPNDTMLGAHILSYEEFVLGVEPDIEHEISMSGAIPKTNASELRLLSGRLTLCT